MEQFLADLFSNAPLLVSFLAGFLTFLSPCILPLIPAYMSYMCGENLHDIKQKKRSFTLLLQAFIFTLGFGLVFVLFGASSARLIDAFAPAWLKQASGAIVILFGLHFLGILRLSFLYKSKHFSLGEKSRFQRFISPFVLGVSFALGWTPCLGPIFASIILLSSTQEGFGVLLLIVYAIGLGVPFWLVALFIQRAFKLFDKLKKHFRTIEILSGILLLGLGGAILFGFMDAFATYLTT